LDLDKLTPYLIYLPLNEGSTIADTTSKTTLKKFTFNNALSLGLLTILTLVGKKRKGCRKREVLHPSSSL
jgi:hypothetical protein